MTIGRKVKAALAEPFELSKTRKKLSVGQALRLARELNAFTQSELARRTGLTQSTVSAIEVGRIRLGIERAKTLARALGVHPAVLLFPSWPATRKSRRAA